MERFWIFAVVFAEFLYNEFDKIVKVEGLNGLAAVRVHGGSVLVGGGSGTVQVYFVPDGLERYEKVFELSDSNLYTFAKLDKNESHVLVFCNVFVLGTGEVPGYVGKEAKNSSMNGMVFVMNSSLVLAESYLIGFCSRNQSVFDGIVYQQSVLALTQCGEEVNLNVLSQGSSPVSLQVKKGILFVLNDFLYIVSNYEFLQITKFDLFLSQIWSVDFQSPSLVVDYYLATSSFFILTSDSLIHLHENGTILNYYSAGFAFKGFTVTDFGFFLISSSSLVWLSKDYSQSSERTYRNISTFISIFQYNASDFILALQSNSCLFSDECTVVLQARLPLAKTDCHKSCFSCYGNTNSDCFTCRYFEVPSQSKLSCGLCDSSCSDCYGPKESQCSSCSPNHIYYKNTCFKDLSCPKGTFQNLIQNFCQSCDSACESCQGAGPNDCIACSKGYLSDGYSCVLKCPAGKYSNSISCLNCNLTCADCYNLTVCKTCAAGYNLYQNLCLPECPQKTYKNKAACLLCPLNCEYCQSDFCLLCSKGFYLNNGSCSECQNNCEICTSYSNCSQCRQGFSLVSNRCQSVCADSQYFYNGTCLTCDRVCLTCSGSSSFCTSCSDYLLNNTCLASCPAGYRSLNNTCEALTCPDSQDENSPKACQLCPSNYVLVNSICLACPLNCESCQDPLACLVCSKNFYLFKAACKPLETSVLSYLKAIMHIYFRLLN